jgi:hypothetical protein
LQEELLGVFKEFEAVFEVVQSQVIHGLLVRMETEFVNVHYIKDYEKLEKVIKLGQLS